jgi:CheY-like chemotaxis protein
VPHTLLLADDSVTIQRVVELTFADQDIRVIAVTDGDQAIAAMIQNPPDIVLADIGMPGRSGYELTQHIRATPRLAHIPVLLLTGAFEPVDQAKAMAVGCNGVLAKPFEPQLLIGRVKELLARSTPAGASRTISPIDAPLAVQRAAQIPPAGSFPHGPPLAAQVNPSTAGNVDSYFDRLDQAFASMSSSPAASLSPPDPHLSAAHDGSDWFSAKRPPQPSEPPLSYGSPQSDFDRPADVQAPIVPEPAVPPVSWSPPAAPTPSAPIALPKPALPVATSFPPLAEAFAALLAAEQGAPPPSAAPAWPAAKAGAPAAVSKDLIEQVTTLVLERLSDRVVRETVGLMVSDVAERLIREEIERIKRNIK